MCLIAVNLFQAEKFEFFMNNTYMITGKLKSSVSELKGPK